MELEDQSEEEEGVSYHDVEHVATERQLPASTVYRDAISGSWSFICLYIILYFSVNICCGGIGLTNKLNLVNCKWQKKIA